MRTLALEPASDRASVNRVVLKSITQKIQPFNTPIGPRPPQQMQQILSYSLSRSLDST